MNPIKESNHSIIIIGFGPAGQKCYAQLRTLLPDASLLIYSDESYRPYNRVKLTELFFNKEIEEVEIIKQLEKDKNTKMVYGVEVISIDAQKMSIKDSLGEVHRYDNLVLATGSKPNIPPKVKSTLEGIFTYRNRDDAQKLAARMIGSRNMVVLGGGLLGIEAAYALKKQHTNVTLINRGDKLLSGYLDERASSLLVEKLESYGIKVILNCSVHKVEGQERISSLVITRKSEEIPCDTLVVAAGISPNIELAYTAPLKFNKGVLVNDHMQTSNPHIYAIGECSEHDGNVYGFVGPAIEQASVAAYHITNPKSEFEYTHSIVATHLKVIDMPIISMGDLTSYNHVLVYEDKEREIYRKLYLHNNRLVAAVGVGEWQESSLLLDEINKKKTVYLWERLSFIKKGSIYITNSSSVLDWPEEKIVCNCKQVPRKSLSDAVAAGCQNLQELSQKTQAGTVCGSCKPLLSQILNVPQTSTEDKVTAKWLNIGGTVVLLLTLIFLFLPKVPSPQSVQEFSLYPLITDPLYREITGFTMLGTSVIMLILSLKRLMPTMMKKSFTFYRGIHIALGVLLPVLLLMHTGASMGERFNFMFITLFIIVLLSGSLATFIIAQDLLKPASVYRPLKSFVTKFHIYALWALPVMVAFHILYFYHF